MALGRDEHVTYRYQNDSQGGFFASQSSSETEVGGTVAYSGSYNQSFPQARSVVAPCCVICDCGMGGQYAQLLSTQSTKVWHYVTRSTDSEALANFANIATPQKEGFMFTFAMPLPTGFSRRLWPEVAASY